MPSEDELEIEAHFGQNLSYLISITHSSLGKLTNRIYASRSLSTHQWKVMSILYYWPPMPAVQITNLCTLDKAAISRGVAGLLKLKLATRHLDEQSGMIFITLTNSGRAMYAAMAEEMTELQNRLLASIDQSERKAFFATLAKIERTVRAASRENAAEQTKSRKRTTRRSTTLPKRHAATEVGSRRTTRSGVVIKAR